MSKFQLILLLVFGVFILMAVFIFSFSRGGNTQSATVTVWGPIPKSEWNDMTNSLQYSQDNTLDIKYEEKEESQLAEEFTQALAVGRGPDVIILPLEDFWQERDKLLLIPFASVSERDFKNTFIEEGELYLDMTREGTYALPLVVDPMVLYYNRDHLTQAGLAAPLAFWDEIYEHIALLAVKDAAGNITRSAIALGEARNIPHAKDIYSLLALQAGTPITTISNGELRPVLTNSFNLTSAPGNSALNFYTQFSNPGKIFYTWNRSLLNADTHFISENSTYYLGFASELRALRAKNPTLNFAVAPMPQSRVSARPLTYGKLYGVSVVKSSRNPSAALGAALKIVSEESSRELSSILRIPSARRGLLAQRPTDDVLSVFRDSALQARGWRDPDSDATEIVFKDMIESVTSGRARISEALGQANEELRNLAEE